MAAVMSSEMQNTDKIVVLIEECRRMGLKLRLPDVNEGEYKFSVNEAGEIVYGLGAIKGLGAGPVEVMLGSRREAGPFRTSSISVPARIHASSIARPSRRWYAAAPSTHWGSERWVLNAALDDALRTAEQNASNRDAGMVDLFGETVHEQPGCHRPLCVTHRLTRPWTDRERLQGERDTLGLYVTGHPIDECEDELRRFAPIRLSEVRGDSRFSCRVAGLIISLRTMNTQRGTMAVFVLDDRSARLEATAYSEVYQKCREMLVKDRIVIVEGRLAQDDRTGAPVMRVSEVRSLAEERARLVTELHITVQAEEADGRFREFLRQALSSAPGECPVCLRYTQGPRSAALRLGSRWRISPSEELLETLRRELGRDRVALQFESRQTPGRDL
jgi:DNA polymerase-3 subunit alpha